MVLVLLHQTMGRLGGNLGRTRPSDPTQSRLLRSDRLSNEIGFRSYRRGTTRLPGQNHIEAEDAIAKFGAAWTIALNQLLAEGLITPHSEWRTWQVT
ncbi:NAD(P)-binding protein [Penicillium sp. IBT 35674x]|nr:NAD(P)-binding protein [Penicillium sp. IBT 35674x]